LLNQLKTLDPYFFSFAWLNQLKTLWRLGKDRSITPFIKFHALMPASRRAKWHNGGKWIRGFTDVRNTIKIGDIHARLTMNSLPWGQTLDFWLGFARQAILQSYDVRITKALPEPSPSLTSNYPSNCLPDSQLQAITRTLEIDKSNRV